MSEQTEKTAWQQFLEEIDPARQKHGILGIGMAGLTVTKVEDDKSKAEIHVAALLPVFDDANVAKELVVAMIKATSDALAGEAGRVAAVSTAKALAAAGTSKEADDKAVETVTP